MNAIYKIEYKTYSDRIAVRDEKKAKVLRKFLRKKPWSVDLIQPVIGNDDYFIEDVEGDHFLIFSSIQFPHVIFTSEEYSKNIIEFKYFNEVYYILDLSKV